MEFNSLSVVYGKPSEKFLKDQALKQSLASEKKYYPEGRGFKNASAADQEKLENQGAATTAEPDQPPVDLLDFGGPPATPAILAQGATTGDLLDTGVDDLLGGFGGNTNQNAQGSNDLLGGDNNFAQTNQNQD